MNDMVATSNIVSLGWDGVHKVCRTICALCEMYLQEATLTGWPGWVDGMMNKEEKKGREDMVMAHTHIHIHIHPSILSSTSLLFHDWFYDILDMRGFILELVKSGQGWWWRWMVGCSYAHPFSLFGYSCSLSGISFSFVSCQSGCQSVRTSSRHILNHNHHYLPVLYPSIL